MYLRTLSYSVQSTFNLETFVTIFENSWKEVVEELSFFIRHN